MKGTVILFARAPRLGTVKTRLARDIGRLKALHFYRNTLTRTANLICARPQWRVSIAVTPDTSDLGRISGMTTAATQFPQGHGDLGSRMARAFNRMSCGPTVIVGTDIPTLTRSDIDGAFQALGTMDAVFGRASDGGYWLVGLSNRRPRPRNLFKDVRWSGPFALSDTLETLPPSWRIGLLGYRNDIDDGIDYEAWRSEGRYVD